jgi:hypothetical protein
MFHNRLDTNEGVSVKKFRGEIKKNVFNRQGKNISPKNGLNVNLLSGFQDPIIFGHSNAGGEGVRGRRGFVVQG